MSKTYPIYFNKKQQEQMLELLDEIGKKAKTQNQGNCTIHEEFFQRIREINPNITSVSANYYDCDGKIAFALKLRNDYVELINFGGEKVKGFVFGAPHGHLTKYYKLRW